MSCTRTQALCRRLFRRENKWMLILVIAGLGIIGAGVAGVVADVRIDGQATANCREIEQIKSYVRHTVERAGRLRDNLDFSLSESDLRKVELQDRLTIRRFHREPCPRTSGRP